MDRAGRQRGGKALKGAKGLFLLSVGAFLLLRGAEAAQGVREGIRLCLDTVIPSLFCFLVFSDFLFKTGGAQAIGGAFAFLGKLLDIPKEAVSIFLFSLVGGYPVGVRQIGEAVRRGELSREMGERLCCFCINGSPAFLIAGVAVPCFGSVLVGGKMLFAQVMAALLTGLLTRLMQKGEGKAEPAAKSAAKPGEKALSALIWSVSAAGKSLFSICLYVLLFAAVMPALKGLPGNRYWAGFLEVTVGCGSLIGRSGREVLILSTLYTAFGGVCVLGQNLAFLRGSGVSLKKFLLTRPFYMGVSLLLTLFLVTPEEAAVSAFAPALPEGALGMGRGGMATAGGSVFLILLCLMLLITEKKYDTIKPFIRIRRPFSGGKQL